MAKCAIADCGKEITSAITGDLCTAHFFESRKQRESAVQQNSDNRPEQPEVKENPSNHESKSILVSMESQEENEPKHAPGLKKVTEAPKDGKKYCQSCIERYGVLRMAEREWTPGFFICQDCLTPLLEQQLDYDSGRVEQLKGTLKTQPVSNSPLLNQVYELMGIPPELRFNDSNKVLNHRNDIFNYHAPAVVNKSIEEIAQQIEVYSIMLFQIKLAIEPLAAYIDNVKARERSAAGLSGLEKSEKEVGKKVKSGVKLSQDEKMAKTLGMTVEAYREMASQARKTEFKKLTS